MTRENMRHITFIGMPSAGKTKIGRRVAELLDWRFVDIDDLIKAHYGAATLKEVVDSITPGEFTALEGAIAIGLTMELREPTIIAPGGSIIYHTGAMEALKERTCIVYLRATLGTIERRIARRPDRGIVFAPGEGIPELYARRVPHYEEWADVTIDADRHRTQIAERFAQQLQEQVL